MTTLLVGFDSAWTRTNRGALVGVLQLDDGRFRELGLPRIVNYHEAEAVILEWQTEHEPTATLILLDQPTIVKNVDGQRPVENLVGSPIGLRYGGTQPANTARREMFGRDAPLWPFLTRFGGPADPLVPMVDTRVFETYPVLAMIALDWTLPDSRKAGRLPKYNPAQKRTFLTSDWRHVCGLASGALRERGLTEISMWIDEAAGILAQHKSDQDRLDACLCLLVGAYLAERKNCLMVGDLQTGYMVVPDSAPLRAELESRCRQTGRAPTDWVRAFRLLAH